MQYIYVLHSMMWKMRRNDTAATSATIRRPAFDRTAAAACDKSLVIVHCLKILAKYSFPLPTKTSSKEDKTPQQLKSIAYRSLFAQTPARTSRTAHGALYCVRVPRARLLTFTNYSYSLLAPLRRTDPLRTQETSEGHHHGVRRESQSFLLLDISSTSADVYTYIAIDVEELHGHR